MTQTPTIPDSGDRHGWHALAVRWPNLPEDVQENLKAEMDRGTRRRFERTVAKMHEDKRLFHQQYCTREDAVKISALFLEQKVMPIAAHVDALEARVHYLELWFWQRWWVTAWTWWLKLNDWLASRGIRLVKLEGDDEHDEADGDIGPLGDEGGTDGRGTEEVHGPPGGDRVQPGRDGGVEPGTGRPSAIEVVSR